MSIIIHSFVCLFFIISTISATVRSPAPAVVYSAIIHNEQNAPIDCYVVRTTSSKDNLQSAGFTIQAKKQYIVDEVVNNEGTFQTRATIKEIHCGQLSITEPFDGVTSPKTNWDIYVEPTKIVSGKQHTHDY